MGGTRNEMAKNKTSFTRKFKTGGRGGRFKGRSADLCKTEGDKVENSRGGKANLFVAVKKSDAAIAKKERLMATGELA